jgi:hypothetical protein
MDVGACGTDVCILSACALTARAIINIKRSRNRGFGKQNIVFRGIWKGDAAFISDIIRIGFQMIGDVFDFKSKYNSKNAYFKALVRN